MPEPRREMMHAWTAFDQGNISSTLRIYARLLQTQAQKFAASETMRTACSTEGCHRYRSKGILERAEFINVPARPG
jgi:hypothetical protein